MSILEILNTLILKPIQLVFEIFYMIVYEITDNPGISIIILSLVMNFLLLPLYKRTDAIQEEEREIEQKLHGGVSHIKKTFHGDERMMILQTYYRQNHYKPTYVLKGAVSLCLEIPFFMAAYAFLSNLQLLDGVSFGPIMDLGKPDGMFTVAGFTVNILPIIMTLINVISSMLYTKGSPLKSKIQLYVMAAIFLVILYQSPSGLVFYWTMNNVFALVKTLFTKTKQPKKVLELFSVAMGIVSIIYAVLICPMSAVKLKVFFGIFGIILEIPLIYHLLKKHETTNFFAQVPSMKNFMSCAVPLVLLTGVLIPASVIAASPQEFIDVTYFYHPMWYVCSAFCLAFGTFGIWCGMFYFLAKENGKLLIESVILTVTACAVIDYMFFGKELGLLSPVLKFENGLNLDRKEIILNVAVLLLVAGVVIYILRHWRKKVFQFMVVVSAALMCMSVINCGKIIKTVENMNVENLASQKNDVGFKLSKKEKNVVVIMLDRAYGGYFPYFINEKPELKKQFDGFTYYSNVISYGGHTNFGAPPLCGGYEYTPIEMNKRADESLVEKHNEALKVMPVLFSKNGYEVTVADPPYANYQWVPDISIFKDMPNVKAFNTEGVFSDNIIKEQIIRSNKRNFFCYSMLKVLPLITQGVLYEDGTYRQSQTFETKLAGQTMKNEFVSEGIDPKFMSAYNVLLALPEITKIVEEGPGQFLFMANNTTHDPMMLQEPGYIPAENVDNTKYEIDNQQRYILNNRRLLMNSERQYIHYQSNMAAMIQMGRWFDYLREEGVYDNTRIILVADHGFPSLHFSELFYGDIEDLSYFYPLLMVKDFNSTGFLVSNEFMTNGDVPTLATKDIIKDPINPFTGKPINSNSKFEGEQFINGSHEFDPEINNGNAFLPSRWFSIHDDIWKKTNWQIVREKGVLPK